MDRRVTDENGLRVSQSDPDYVDQCYMSNAQDMWEQYWYRPTTNPTRLMVHDNMRAIQEECGRVANALELGWVSPRALARLQQALALAAQIGPATPPEEVDRKVDAAMGPTLRRIDRAHGHDYGVLRLMSRLEGNDDEG